MGTLELDGPDGPLAYWRYTVGRAAAAHRLAQRLEGLSPTEADDDASPARSAISVPDLSELNELMTMLERRVGPRTVAIEPEELRD